MRYDIFDGMDDHYEIEHHVPIIERAREDCQTPEVHDDIFGVRYGKLMFNALQSAEGWTKAETPTAKEVQAAVMALNLNLLSKEMIRHQCERIEECA